MIHATTPTHKPDAFKWEEALARTPQVYITQTHTQAIRHHASYRAVLFASVHDGRIIPTIVNGTAPIDTLEVPDHENIAYSDPLPTAREASRLIIAWCLANNYTIATLPFEVSSLNQYLN